MTRAGVLLLAGLLLAAAPAAAQGKKATVTVTVEIEFEDLKAMSELPTTVDEAADAGSTEAEITKAFDALKLKKIKGKPAKAIGLHFKNQAEKELSDEGLGDIVKECVDKGLEGDDLVECVTGEWKKKPPKDRPHPVVKAKAKDAAPPAAVKVKPAVAPAKVTTGGDQHKAVSTGVGKTKKKGALKK